MTFAYIYQNRLAKAEALLQKAAERGIKSLVHSLCRYFIAFLKRDDAAMEREKIERQAKMEAQGWFEHQEALTMAYHGRLKDAARLSERAVILSRQAGLRERAAQFAGARAAWSALMGAPAEAKSSAAEALLHRSRDADYGPAFALALPGESAQAHQIEVELEKNTRRTRLSNSVTCLRCGRSRFSTQAIRTRETRRKRSQRYKWQLRTTLLFRVQRSIPALSSELFIRSTCVVSLMPEWAVIARQRLNFKRLSIIPTSR